jgi:histidyl-tRNA synthetase
MTVTGFPTNPYKGTRDFYPEDLIKRDYIFDTWRQTLVELGFSQYETSLLENADIYIAKSGSELGGSQLYNFKDKGDRFVALRPEQTPSLARLVAARYKQLRFPLRWFSIPNCFRYERPQKGRLREHWQLNVDILGLEAGAAELELINVLASVYKAFGVDKNHFKLMYNHRRLLDDWLEDYDLTAHKELVYRVLDDWFKKSLDENISELRSPATRGNETDNSNSNEVGIADNDQIQALIELTSQTGPAFDKYLHLSQNYPEIDLLQKLTPKLHPTLEFELNPCIIRGIAYYTGFVVEAFDKHPGNPRALNGGGRYDNLMEIFDAPPTPAIGFGMGDVTMLSFLENWGLLEGCEQFENWALLRQPIRVGLLPKTPANLEKIYLDIIPNLRNLGKTWEIDYDYHRSPNKRYESMKKKGCAEVIEIF